MKMFKNESEMLIELDHFIYKMKSLYDSKLREKLLFKINEFLSENDLDEDQHDYVGWHRAFKEYWKKEKELMDDIINKNIPYEEAMGRFGENLKLIPFNVEIHTPNFDKLMKEKYITNF